jgi:hypothetical protein
MDAVHYINDEEVTIKETRWINVVSVQSYSQKKRERRRRGKKGISSDWK